MALVQEARSTLEIPIEGVLGHFVDSTYSYRFGPLRHDAVIARMILGDAVLSEAVYRTDRSTMTTAAGVDAEVREGPRGALSVALRSASILYGVRMDVRDHRPVDNHFTLTPGRPRMVELRRISDSGRPFHGYVEAMNLVDSVSLSAPG